MVFTLSITGTLPCNSGPPPLTGGFFINAVAGEFNNDQPEVFVVGDQFNTCEQIIAAGQNPFAFVQDLSGTYVTDNPTGFLFSPGNGFKLTDNIPIPLTGGTSPGNLCGIKGNTITFKASNDGGLGRYFSAVRPESGSQCFRIFSLITHPCVAPFSRFRGFSRDTHNGDVHDHDGRQHSHMHNCDYHICTVLHRDYRSDGCLALFSLGQCGVL